MVTLKEECKGIIDGYYYACCPYCKNVLVQAQNGMNGYIKCPKCDNYIHIIIRNGTVNTKTKS